MPNANQVLGLAGNETSALADVTDLVPADVYSTKVLETLYGARKLAGIIAAVKEELTAEAGSTVQVPYMNPRTAQGAIAEGVSLLTHKTTTGVYPISLSKYGDADLINNEVFEDQVIFGEEDYANNIAKGLAKKIDQLNYAAIKDAAAVKTSTLAVAGTLTDLYAKLVDLIVAMRGQEGIEPSHVIIHPSQEGQFLKDTDQGIKYDQIAIEKGRLTMLAGLEVIVTVYANANAATAAMVQAVVIDAARAVGEAWGRRPTKLVDKVSKALSDQTLVVSWIRYGVAAMDLKAVGHVKNP